MFDMGKNIGSHAMNTVKETATEQMNNPANVMKAAAAANQVQ